MSEPLKVNASTQTAATGEKPQLYKRILNEYAQKLWKKPPVYETHNEGSGHEPKFRCTVWADGVSYTSQDTFKQRKTAEADASRIALFATMLKLKNEALRLVHEDIWFSKSILVEYAARMNIPKPTYKTVQLDATVPVFCSSLEFNDVSCTGDSCKSKKEAEQSAARAAILKYLDSDKEKIMSEIINCKFRNHAELKDIPGAHNGTNAVVQTGVCSSTNAVIQTGFNNCITSNEAKVEDGTKMLTTAQPDPSMVQGTTTIPPRDIPQESTEARTPVIPQESTQAHTPVILQESTQARTPVIPQESTQACTPVIPVPTVLAQAPYAGINNALVSSQITPPSLEDLARIIATHLSSNVFQSANSEAPSGVVAPPLSLQSPALAQTAAVSQASGKKRSRKNKKKTQKKMRADDQSSMPGIALGQFPTFSAQ